jgi:hypothetical protein
LVYNNFLNIIIESILFYFNGVRYLMVGDIFKYSILHLSQKKTKIILITKPVIMINYWSWMYILLPIFFISFFYWNWETASPFYFCLFFDFVFSSPTVFHKGFIYNTTFMSSKSAMFTESFNCIFILFNYISSINNIININPVLRIIQHFYQWT